METYIAPEVLESLHGNCSGAGSLSGNSTEFLEKGGDYEGMLLRNRRFFEKWRNITKIILKSP